MIDVFHFHALEVGRNVLLYIQKCYSFFFHLAKVLATVELYNYESLDEA